MCDFSAISGPNNSCIPWRWASNRRQASNSNHTTTMAYGRTSSGRWLNWRRGSRRCSPNPALLGERIRFVLQRSIGPIADPGQRFAALLYFLQPNRGHVLLQTGLFLRRALLDTVLHGDGLSGGLETVAEKTAKVFGPLLPWFICAIRPPGPPGGGWSFFRFLAICRLPIAGQPGLDFLLPNKPPRPAMCLLQNVTRDVQMLGHVEQG